MVFRGAVVRGERAKQAAMAAGLSALLVFGVAVIDARAQEETPTPTATPQSGKVTNTFEGVVDTIDKDRRGPVLSVSTETDSNSIVKILADAYVPNESFAKYPIQFDFFINRKLFVSQIRSEALPGAVGVEVGPDYVQPPFNYTVVAKVLHPNRNFTTVIEGAVNPSSSETTGITFASCTVFRSAVEESESTFNPFQESATTEAEFTASDVPATKITSGGYSLDFTATGTEGSVAVKSTLTFNEDSAAGSLEVTDSSTHTLEVTGTATLENDAPTEFSVDANDGSYSLECSSSASIE